MNEAEERWVAAHEWENAWRAHYGLRPLGIADARHEGAGRYISRQYVRQY